ncbi:MAG: T9SS type A sorting domain-containing protein [bacterium]|nr:T9SS type A sorting domain-containing protein [bacterium]
MHRRMFFHALLFTLLVLAGSACAEGTVVIDALHGQPDAASIGNNPDLSALYPDFRFVPFSASRLPIYHVLAEGTFSGQYYDSIAVTVPEDEDALYVVLDAHVMPGGQWPVPVIIGPDQQSLEGGYGTCHVDDPIPGRYVIYVGYLDNGLRYQIGTGPHLWSVYPPDDYDAVVDFYCTTMMLFNGRPVPRSNYDLTLMQQFVNAGGGIGLFYDGTEPIALKPILHLHDFANDGATVQIEVPGHVTYSVPTPQKTRPLTWEIAPTRNDVELDYEAEFHQPLNFLAPGSRAGEYVNRSWATVRDAKILRFELGKGYSTRELGTLAPGEKALAANAAALPFSEARTQLDDMLRREGEAAGLTIQENESFFHKYQWAMRLLTQCSDAEGEIALYRIEGSDYDALFPLATDPAPAETRRVLWVYSILPDAVREIALVHPRVTEIPCAPAERITGVYHEYGFFRETYGGDALDEMDEWGWHFYDQPLDDPTDPGEDWYQFYFDTWGQSPLVPELSAGVTRLLGQFTGGIEPQAGTVEVILSGDEDTQGAPFVPGSYPPVVVGRQETSGGRVAGYSDLMFLADYADNRQFSDNVFTWLTGGATGGGPDIDIAEAVIQYELPENETGFSGVKVCNRGREPLILTSTPPASGWLTVNGPTNVTIAAGDSVYFNLTWNSTGVEPGYITTYWSFTSNDPNEATLMWPVRLHVLAGSAAEPPLSGVPSRFALLPVYPNPFNPRTQATIQLPQAAEVLLDIYDVLGRHVERVLSERWEAGLHEVSLDFSSRPAGLYFLRAQAGGAVQVQKAMYLR